MARRRQKQTRTAERPQAKRPQAPRPEAERPEAQRPQKQTRVHTDEAIARDVDLGYRILGVTFLTAGSVWVTLAIVLALEKRVSAAAAIAIGVVGAIASLVLRFGVSRRRHQELALFKDETSGKVTFPLGHLPLPRPIRAWSAAVVPIEILVIVVVAATHK